MGNVIFNVLAKDLENAKELTEVAGNRVLVGVMVKNFATNEEAITRVNEYKENGIPVSVGLGAGDPTMWKRVAEVAAATKPDHINQVFPASGYTLGRMSEIGQEETIVNALIEPSGKVGEVYITSGSDVREKVSCDLAAKLLSEIGLKSVKFYSIDGDKKLDELAAMVQAAKKAGLTTFEPTGGIDMENVHIIVKTCLENGAETVIPHLYTSLIDKQTGKTESSKIKDLLEMVW